MELEKQKYSYKRRVGVYSTVLTVGYRTVLDAGNGAPGSAPMLPSNPNQGNEKVRTSESLKAANIRCDPSGEHHSTSCGGVNTSSETRRIVEF